MSLHWHNLWRCFLADSREVGISNSLWWFVRFGLVSLLPPPIKSLLRLCYQKLALGSADARVANAVWLTDALQKTMEERRKTKTNTSAIKSMRLGQQRQRRLLADAYIPLASELEERMASWLGIELRQPMQASRLVEFAIATPERLRIRGKTNKFMHVQAMQNVLPERVLNRRTKADFSILFRQYLEHIEKDLLQDIPEKRRSWVETDRIQAVFEYYREQLAIGRSSSGEKAQWILWNLLGCYLLSK